LFRTCFWSVSGDCLKFFDYFSMIVDASFDPRLPRKRKSRFSQNRAHARTGARFWRFGACAREAKIRRKSSKKRSRSIRGTEPLTYLIFGTIFRRFWLHFGSIFRPKSIKTRLWLELASKTLKRTMQNAFKVASWPPRAIFEPPDPPAYP